MGLDMANAKVGGESGKTVTRADLSEIVYQKIGLSRTESAELVQSVLDEICDAAARGETVKLSGFGSFVVRSKGERVGRNPKTGVEVRKPTRPVESTKMELVVALPVMVKGTVDAVMSSIENLLAPPLALSLAVSCQS